LLIAGRKPRALEIREHVGLLIEDSTQDGESNNIIGYEFRLAKGWLNINRRI
jgi:hypothetical protein